MAYLSCVSPVKCFNTPNSPGVFQKQSLTLSPTKRLTSPPCAAAAAYRASHKLAESRLSKSSSSWSSWRVRCLSPGILQNSLARSCKQTQQDTALTSDGKTVMQRMWAGCMLYRKQRQHKTAVLLPLVTDGQWCLYTSWLHVVNAEDPNVTRFGVEG